MSMISSITSRIKVPESWQIRPSPALNKAALILGITLLYVITFKPISERFGVVSPPVVAVPVILAGWFFGIRAGLAASFISILLNILLFKTTLANGGELWVEISWFGDLMTILVGVVAGSLHDSVEKRERANLEIKAKEDYSSILNDITRIITGTQDYSQMMIKLELDVASLLEADSSKIIQWDATHERILRSIPSRSMTEFSDQFPYITDLEHLTQTVLNAGHTLTTQEIFNSSFVERDKASNLEIHSLLAIPLIVGNHKLGIILITHQTQHAPMQNEVERADEMGNRIALALWSVQQESELQQRLREAKTLTDIAQALGETERIGLDNVLQLIVTSAIGLIPSADQSVIHLLDEEKKYLSPKAVSGFDKSIKGTARLHPNKSVAGQTLASGETIIIEDTKTDPRFLSFGASPSYHSLMVAPVQSGQQKLGTISVQSRSIKAFTEAESKLLSSLGIQAAIAIENTRLLESTQQALKETNSLYRINQGLVSSLDPQQLIKDTVDLLQKNFGYYHVQIYVVDQKSGDFVMEHGSGAIGKTLKEQNHRLRAGEGIVGYTAESGSPFFTNNVDEVFAYVRNPILPDTKSELTVPIKSGDQILGLLDIQQIANAMLTQRDVQLVSAVADQLAIMLQKAILYEDLQTSLHQEKAIRNQLVQNERLAVMGRLLASVSHELNNPLQAIQNALFLLKEEKSISEQGKKDLEIVLAESERMADLIDRLRDTYRPTQEEEYQLTQINNLIEDVLALTSTHLRHHKIDFDFQPEPELPAIYALADQLRQVILNLVMNAVESIKTDGKLKVSTNYLKDDREILLKISDSGKGIDPIILPHIFEAFITNKEKGTGLGLTITYDIISKHRGRITAENNPDRGATFKVWLPLENRELA
jgi:signal transduction histidine kinase